MLSCSCHYQNKQNKFIHLNIQVGECSGNINLVILLNGLVCLKKKLLFFPSRCVQTLPCPYIYFNCLRTAMIFDADVTEMDLTAMMLSNICTTAD